MPGEKMPLPSLLLGRNYLPKKTWIYMFYQTSVTSAVMPSKGISFTLGNLICNCSVQCWHSIDGRISTALDVHCLENKAFLTSCMVQKLWSTRGLLFISLQCIDQIRIFFHLFFLKALIEFSFYCNSSSFWLW